jgi:hypothetical protein
MPTFTKPGPTAQQMSGNGPNDRPLLSVLTKRTYRVELDGRCILDGEQVPLVVDALPDPDNPGVFGHDTDLYPFKPLTDVVVKGHATTYPARPRFDAVVEVGAAKKTVAVFGDRLAALAGGEIIFAPPAPVERVPLRYDKAYGGADTAALEKYGDPYAELRPFLSPEIALAPAEFYTYPRNACGTGYIFEPTVEAVNRLVLPNLEDPHDLLTSKRLLVGQPGRWPRMPIPHSFGWIETSDFPRMAYLGVPPVHEPFEGPLPEAARGWAPDSLLKPEPLMVKFSYRLANGASLGLQLPYLRGDEDVRLTHIHAKHRQVTIRLPGDRPRIWIDGRKAGLKETEPVLHTVLIDADAGRVSLVWRGAAEALRQYSQEELEKMPLKVEWRP